MKCIYFACAITVYVLLDAITGTRLVAATNNVLDVIHKGAELQRVGRLNEAKEIYLKVLDSDPHNVDALNLLGAIQFEQKNLREAASYFQKATSVAPDRADIWSNQCEAQRQLNTSASLRQAVEAGRNAATLSPENPSILYNFALALASAGHHSEAMIRYYSAGQLNLHGHFLFENWILLMHRIPPQDALVYVNQQHFRFLETHASAVRERLQQSGWSNLQVATLLLRIGSLLQHLGFLDRAERLYSLGEMVLGTSSLHNQNTASTALHELSPEMETMKFLLLNQGAVHQARGHFQKAISKYSQLLLIDANDSAGFNNMGACQWFLGHQTEALKSYEQALNLDPNNVQAMINLASSAYEVGDIDKAKLFYRRALSLDPNLAGVRVRIASMISPVMSSKSKIYADRESFKTNVQDLIRMALSTDHQALSIMNPVTSVERLHFYFVYHGESELGNQVMMRKLFHLTSGNVLDYVSPTLKGYYQNKDTKLLGVEDKRAGSFQSTEPEKIQVAFISKFWHANHPHGQLLQGILRYLLETKKYFVTILAIPNPAGGVSDELLSMMQHEHGSVIDLESSFHEMQLKIGSMNLDILVFVDTMSEPLNYFLSFSRFAPVQVAFWGNPLTTGSKHTIDYFISGDWMEENLAGLYHYSEQLVLLPGTGIWYDPPVIPDDARWFARLDPQQPLTDEENLSRAQQLKTRLRRAAFPGEAWVERAQVVYMVAQSIFKLHPEFDDAIAQILQQVEGSHFIFLQGRQVEWTLALRARLEKVIGTTQCHHRIHFHPRVKGEAMYMKLLTLADIVLHPFPFGGSKTSVDVLALGLPLVTMRGSFLRGRMASAFYRKLQCGLDGLSPLGRHCPRVPAVRDPTHLKMVARWREEYVEIAVRLGKSSVLRASVSTLVLNRSHLLFGDEQVAQGWDDFLSRAAEAARPAEEELVGAPGAKAGTLEHLNSSGLQVSGDRAFRTMGQHDALQVSKKELLLKIYEVYSRGELTETQELLAVAVTRWPEDPFVQNDFAAVLQQLGDLNGAEEHFRAALELKPDYATATNNLGVTLQSLGKFDEAIETYTSAWRLAPGWESPIYNLGNALKNRGMVGKAIRMYQTVFGLESVPVRFLSVIIVFALSTTCEEDWLAPYQGNGVLADSHNHQCAQCGGENSNNSFRGLGQAFEKTVDFLNSGNLLPSAGNTWPLPFKAGGENGCDCNMFDTVKRMASKFQKSANNLVQLLDVEFIPSVLKMFSRELETSLGNRELDSKQLQLPAQELERVYVVTQYFLTNSPHRQHELALCLLNNLHNEHVKEVHILTEYRVETADLVEHLFDVQSDPRVVQSFAAAGQRSRSGIQELMDSKLVQYVVGHRLRFQSVVAYTRQTLFGKLCAFANADIFLDDSLGQLSRFIPRTTKANPVVLALLRWEHTVDSKPHLNFRTDSQDTWIFRSPINLIDEKIGDFELGRPRCDNRFAKLLKDSGYRVLNAAWDVITHHVHSSTSRNHAHTDNIPGTQEFVPVLLPNLTCRTNG